MRYLALFILLLATSWACQPEEACISSATSRLVVDFYVDTRTGPVQDSIQFRLVKSTASDSVFWSSESDSTARLLLRLNPDKDTTTFVFQGVNRNRAFNDTLVFRYQRRYRLISPDCPLEVSYRQLEVLRASANFARFQVINTELMEPSNEMDVQVILPRP